MALDLDELAVRVYEAAAIPELWVSTLSEIGQYGDGVGALLFTSQGDDFRYVASPKLQEFVAEFMSGGWVNRDDRPARLFSKPHAGFLTDLEVYTPEEIEANPMFTEFLRPNGLDFGAATAITVPRRHRHERARRAGC